MTNLKKVTIEAVIEIEENELEELKEYQEAVILLRGANGTKTVKAESFTTKVKRTDIIDMNNL